MLFYFSGTGNSKYIALTLGNLLGEKIYFIPETNPLETDVTGEKIIFVFPVYSWGVPPIVEKFILSFSQSFWEEVGRRNCPVVCVMSCGDEVALAPEIFLKTFSKLNMEVSSIWSVIMPNNYVLLPGFDVDPKDVESKKLSMCRGRILEIAQGIQSNIKTIDVVRGNIPWLKTRIVFPLFKRWGIFPSKWHYTGACISCGKCASSCPLINIVMENGHPNWGSRCCSCLACYHICPSHAVAYAKETRKKGQYFFPLNFRRT